MLAELGTPSSRLPAWGPCGCMSLHFLSQWYKGAAPLFFPHPPLKTRARRLDLGTEQTQGESPGRGQRSHCHRVHARRARASTIPYKHLQVPGGGRRARITSCTVAFA